MNVNQLISTLRNEIGMSQERLAELAGLSQQTISKIENHQDVVPRPGTVYKIAKVFLKSGVDKGRLRGLLGDFEIGGQPFEVKQGIYRVEEMPTYENYKKLTEENADQAQEYLSIMCKLMRLKEQNPILFEQIKSAINTLF